MKPIFRLFGEIAVDTKKSDESIDKVNSKAKKLVGGLGKLAVGAGVAGAALAGAATKQAADFEKQMANVATLLDGDVSKKLEGMGKDVKKLAVQTGTSTDLLSDGLYQVVSAFGDTADSMNILETASKGAAAGNATVTDSVNLLSAITKGYGDTSAEAVQKASDLAFQTVKMGQTTFPELAASMGKVVPIASSMSVSQEELFGVMSTLTGVTGSAAEVSTQFRGVLQGLMKPTAGMSEVLAEMGYESGQALIESEGLQGGMMGMMEAADNLGIPMDQLFSSVEGLTAAMALTGSQADVWMEKQDAMVDSSGSTEDAFKTQTETVNGMTDRMKQLGNTVLISFGEQILPIVNKFLQWVMDHIPEIQSFFETAFDVISTAVGFFVDLFTDHVFPVLADLWEWIQPHLPKIQEIFETVFGAIGSVIDGVVQSFKNVIDWAGRAWDKVSSIASSIKNVGSGIASFFGFGGGRDIDGMRANGGPVRAGGSYVVGERGPEIFTPSTSGSIIPNGGGGISIRIDAGNIVGANAGDELGDMLVEILRRKGVVTA